jgi:Rrf2 family protein
MLFLPKKTLCALEAVLDIALAAQHDSLTCTQLTENQKIAKRYLERILQNLVHAEILTGQRGPSGGYRLARERRNISIGDILRALDDSEENKKKNSLPHSLLGKQIIAPLCGKLSQEMLATLDKITIEELVKNAKKCDIIKTPPQVPPDFNI